MRFQLGKSFWVNHRTINFWQVRCWWLSIIIYFRVIKILRICFMRERCWWRSIVINRMIMMWWGSIVINRVIMVFYKMIFNMLWYWSYWMVKYMVFRMYFMMRWGTIFMMRGWWWRWPIMVSMMWVMMNMVLNSKMISMNMMFYYRGWWAMV